MKVGCDTPFFIWFTGRTGSTLLCDLLQSHPDIYCRMEDFSELAIAADDHTDLSDDAVEFNGVRYIRRIFCPDGEIHQPNRQQVLDYLEQIFSVSESACGFKFKFPSQAAVYPEVIQELKKTDQLKVISLVRDNVLKQAISLRNVERLRDLESKISCNVTTNVELEPLEADVPLIMKHARYFLKSRSEFDAVANQFSNVLQITYEQLNSNIAATTRSILEFLNVDPDIELETKFYKATPDAVADAIANYDELVEGVAGTELEAFLD